MFLAVYRGCLIAYGQTGAGKTFTMQGPDEHTVDADAAMDEVGSVAAAAAAAAVSVPEDMKGLIPRVLGHVFQRIEDEKAATNATAPAIAAENNENGANAANTAAVGLGRYCSPHHRLAFITLLS